MWSPGQFIDPTTLISEQVKSTSPIPTESIAFGPLQGDTGVSLLWQVVKRI
jgi:hypothetical protein